jgi:O-antigen/teichoic acid export membrane protein
MTLEDAIVGAFAGTLSLLHYAGSTKACWRRPHAGGARGGLGFDSQLARMQLKHSLPFAMASGSFALRAQAGQWVVAANFPSAAVELISIASAVMAVGTLTGQPLGNALLSNISSLVGEGNVDGARKLISEAYLLPTPCGGQGRASAERRQSALHVTSLAREAVAAQKVYETIWA